MTTEQLLKLYNKKTKENIDSNPKERALYFLLKDNEDKIKGWIEDDPSGFSFHKSFRQTDVTNNANVDLAIWFLLQDAPLFWKIIESYNNFVGQTIKAYGQIVKINDVNCDNLNFGGVVLEHPIVVPGKEYTRNEISFEEIQEVLKDDKWIEVKLINYWF